MDTLDPAGAEFLRISERYRQMSDEELLVLIPQSSELTPIAQQALAGEVRQRGLKPEVEEEDKRPSAPSQFKSPQFKSPQFNSLPKESGFVSGYRFSDTANPSKSIAPLGAEGRTLISPQPLQPTSAFFEHESPKFRDSASYDSSGPESSDPASSEEDPYDEDRKLIELCTVWSVRDALKVQTILDEAEIPFFMGPEQATAADRVTSNFSSGVGVQIMQIGLPWARSAMQHYEPEDDPTPRESEELEELAVRCPKCHSEEVVFEGRTSEPAIASDESSEKFKWTCDSCGHHWEDDGVAKEE